MSSPLEQQGAVVDVRVNAGTGRRETRNSGMRQQVSLHRVGLAPSTGDYTQAMIVTEPRENVCAS
jgi:hypothetical protein